MSFAHLGLSAPILRAVTEQGYSQPTPIQAKAIPAIMAGRDVMAAAQTGTGKTAAFTLPMLHRLSVGEPVKANQARALVLVPTRELAIQVSKNIESYSSNLSLSVVLAYGGVKINPQMMKLRKGADILIATPGRLFDLYKQNAVTFRQLEVLVLDEADRMLDMGFLADIKRILNLLPKTRQNLLFSATFSEEIRDLAKRIVNDPLEISVAPRNSAAGTVKQWLHPVDKKRKPELLSNLIRRHKWQQVLVFVKTKIGADKLARHLESEHITTGVIHGDKKQGARTRALNEFKAGGLNVLVATDIAARGIDIDTLPQVVNFDLPMVAEDYVHRIGRTGRAGSRGEAISLVCATEYPQLSEIERLMEKIITREYVEGYIPNHELPESSLNPNRPRPNKAKKRGQSAGAGANSSKNKGKRKPAKGARKPAGKSAGKTASKPKRDAAGAAKVGQAAGAKRTKKPKQAKKEFTKIAAKGNKPPRNNKPR